MIICFDDNPTISLKRKVGLKMLLQAFDTIFTLISIAINIFSICLVAVGLSEPEILIDLIMRL